MSNKELYKLHLHILRRHRNYLEQAAEIGGYRSLNDFIIHAASEKADAIIERHSKWQFSEDNRETFFSALMNHPDRSKSIKRPSKLKRR